MASMSSTTNGKVEHAADAARDAFNTTRDSFNDASKTARENFNDASDAVKKAARVGAKEAAAYGRENADRAYATAQDVGRSVQAYIKEKPVHAALIGLGGLMLASMLFRRR
jgi:ElaB/YqjD/DUF883 family membrane-anchored ribosome-binding protein